MSKSGHGPQISIAILLLLATSLFAIPSGVQQIVQTHALTASPTTVTYATNGNTIGSSLTTNVLTLTWSATAPSAGNAVALVTSWASTATSITSVGDGTGTGQTTGSSTYTCQPTYANASNFNSAVCYTCNYAGVSGSGKGLAITFSGTPSSFAYGAAVYMTGNTTSGTNCSDGYNKAQSTSNGTAVLSGTIATTNAHDLLVGFQGNNTGGTTTAGADGQGNTMTLRSNASGVADVETFSESATNTYSAAFTISSSKWNGMVMGFK